MEPATLPSAPSRRADIDSLRVLALALLIVYHVLLIYTGVEFWRANSSHSGYWADYLLALIAPWRMPLVFLIGGMALRFMFARPSYGAFVRERAARLLTAFAFAVVVLVPPQVYFRDSTEDYFTFLLTEAPFATAYLGVRLPDFAHAWFLPYLFAYSVVVGALWWFGRRLFTAMQGFVERLPLVAPIAATMLLFAFIDGYMIDAGGARLFLTDYAGHLKYFPVFLLGALLGQSARFTERLDAMKFPLWGLSIVLMGANAGLKYLYFHDVFDTAQTWLLVRGLFGGLMIYSVLAFGHWALNRPSTPLTYASDAILPVYLMHQTALILTADAILGLRWPVALEFICLFVSASLIPLLIYHALVRRTPWLRFLFGLRPYARKTGAQGEPSDDKRGVAAPHVAR